MLNIDLRKIEKLTTREVLAEVDQLMSKHKTWIPFPMPPKKVSIRKTKRGEDRSENL